MRKLKSLFIVSAAILLSFISIGFTNNIAYVSADTPLLTVKLEKSYLEAGVVSEEFIILNSEVRNAQLRRIYDKEIVYTLTAESSVAELVDGSKLLIKDIGSFTLRASLKDNSSVFDEYTGTSKKIEISQVNFLTNLENVTIYTQPVLLIGDAVVKDVPANKLIYREVKFKIVSGPAEIFSDEYIKFTDTGEVVVEAYSRFDQNVSTRKTITVTDPDAGKQLAQAGQEFYQQGGSENGLIILLAIAAPVLILGGLGAALFIKKKKKV